MWGWVQAKREVLAARAVRNRIEMRVLNGLTSDRGPRQRQSVKIGHRLARFVLLFRLRSVLDRRSDVNRCIQGLIVLPLLLVLALGARTDAGTTLQDLVRLKGHDRVVLQGLGLVVGLSGTGDTSKDSWPPLGFSECLRSLNKVILSKSNSFKNKLNTFSKPISRLW